jgi:hypothetical protein
MVPVSTFPIHHFIVARFLPGQEVVADITMETTLYFLQM